MDDLTTAELAIVIAVMSFSVALLSLVWNILNATLVDRARLKVKMWATVMPESKSLMHHVIRVEATNYGKRPVKLSSLWIQHGPRPRWWHKILPSKVRDWIYHRKPGGIFTPGEPWFSQWMPDLPASLDVGGSETILYGQEQLHALAEKAGAKRCTRLLWAPQRGPTPNPPQFPSSSKTCSPRANSGPKTIPDVQQKRPRRYSAKNSPV